VLDQSALYLSPWLARRMWSLWLVWQVRPVQLSHLFSLPEPEEM